MAIRNRLCPGSGQLAFLGEHCAHARRVWNLAVEQQSWWWPGRGSAPSVAERYRQLAQARRAEPGWALGPRRYSSRRCGTSTGPWPRSSITVTRPVGRVPGPRGAQGFAIRDTRVRRVSPTVGEVHVPKCGWVRFRWTRPLPLRLGVARVTCDRAGRWHVSFPAPQPPVAREPTGKTTAVDRGVCTALVTSDGHHYRAPRTSDRHAARYLALQRRLARQRKGSGKRERTRQAMALIAARAAGQRQDWAEKPVPGWSATTTSSSWRSSTSRA